MSHLIASHVTALGTGLLCILILGSSVRVVSHPSSHLIGSSIKLGLLMFTQLNPVCPCVYKAGHCLD